MIVIAYMLWGIMGTFMIKAYIFDEVWNTKKKELGFVNEYSIAPDIYKNHYKHTMIRRQFRFFVSSICYMLVILAFHYCTYIWAIDLQLKEILLQTIYILALVLSLCIGNIDDEVVTGLSTSQTNLKSIAKFIYILRDKAMNSAISDEEIQYKSFIMEKVNEIGNDEHLRILFVLKFTDVQLHEILDSVSEEAMELLPNLLLKAHDKDINFKELMEKIFIKDFIKMKIPIQEIVGIFQYCTIEELKNRDLYEDKKALDEILKKLENKTNEEHSNSNMETKSISEKDAIQLEEVDVDSVWGA